MADKFPKPYQNSVPKEGTDRYMETVDFDKMGIGARSSGQPGGGEASRGPKPIDHVGGTAGGR
jgi:hypothetical protein